MKKFEIIVTTKQGEKKVSVYVDILITNNESNICQKVTIPRIQKAIKLFMYEEDLEICYPVKD